MRQGAALWDRVAARFLSVLLYLDVTSHITNIMQGFKWNADVSWFERQLRRPKHPCNSIVSAL